MGLLSVAKDSVSGLIQALGAKWWLEVVTTDPRCKYYFGPFDKAAEAQEASPGYIQDLEGEGAQGIVSTIKRCNPRAITIEELVS